MELGHSTGIPGSVFTEDFGDTYGRTSVADPGFPRGGAPTPKGANILFDKFFLKTV